MIIYSICGSTLEDWLYNKTSIGTRSVNSLKIDTVLWKFKEKKIKSSWPDCDKVDVEERDK